MSKTNTLTVSSDLKNIILTTNGNIQYSIPLNAISKATQSVIMPLNDTLPAVAKQGTHLKTDEYVFPANVTEEEITRDIIHNLAVLKYLHDNKK